MDAFNFNLPTHIHFSDHHIEALKEALAAYTDKKILFLYGEGSIKRLGLYEDVKTLLKSLNIDVEEFGGIPANPTLSKVLEARALIVKTQRDFILAVGGGSVMDAAKAMAVAALVPEEEVWDIFERKRWFDEALPLGVVVTLSGTGSEVNGNAVINNDFTGIKWSIGSPLLRPVFAVINPAFQNGLKTEAYQATTLDIIHHTLEQFIDDTEETSTADYLMVGLIKSVQENFQKVLEDHATLETYKNLSWASSLGLSFLFQQGKKGAWESHRISYPITAKFNVVHGYALTMVIPAWLSYVYDEENLVFMNRLDFLGQHLFNGARGQDVIKALKAYYQSTGAPVTWEEAGLSKPDENTLQAMAHDVMKHGDLGKLKILNEASLMDIYHRIGA